MNPHERAILNLLAEFGVLISELGRNQMLISQLVAENVQDLSRREREELVARSKVTLSQLAGFEAAIAELRRFDPEL